MRFFSISLTILLLLAPALGPAATQWEDDWYMGDVPYVPTPDTIVDAMLELAGVKSSDVVYDLGCGDGRIVITAASKFGARGVGVDLNPARIEEANENAKKAGVQDKVRFVEADLFKAEISDATVVTLYLLSTVNKKLKPRLLKELKPGTRVVSHRFSMGDDWEPERQVNVEDRPLYLWTVPEPAAAPARASNQ